MKGDKMAESYLGRQEEGETLMTASGWEEDWHSNNASPSLHRGSTM